MLDYFAKKVAEHKVEIEKAEAAVYKANKARAEAYEKAEEKWEKFHTECYLALKTVKFITPREYAGNVYSLEETVNNLTLRSDYSYVGRSQELRHKVEKLASIIANAEELLEK